MRDILIALFGGMVAGGVLGFACRPSRSELEAQCERLVVANRRLQGQVARSMVRGSDGRWKSE